MASVTWKGIAGVNAALEALKRRLNDAGKQAAKSEAQKILATAQANAPILTGELRASGTVEDAPDGRSRVLFTADHAAVVHQRHPTHSGYLKRAVDANRTEQGFANKLRSKLR